MVQKPTRVNFVWRNIADRYKKIGRKNCLFIKIESVLVVHGDEKLGIRQLEKEVLKHEKLVDVLIKTYPHRIKLINEKN